MRRGAEREESAARHAKKRSLSVELAVVVGTVRENIENEINGEKSRDRHVALKESLVDTRALSRKNLCLRHIHYKA